MKKIFFVFLALVSLSTFAQERSDKNVLKATINQLESLASDTLEEGDYRVEILKSKSNCNVRPAAGKYPRYYCTFEIRVTETAVRPYNIIVKGCEINFFSVGNDLSTLHPNKDQVTSCFEYLTSGD